MSEVEFDRLLDAVNTAVAAPAHHHLGDYPTFNAPMVAANDNQMAWPYLPFPDGWYAS